MTLRDGRITRELEGHDPLAEVPARYLSAPGFALRLLRLMDEHQRAGVDAEAILGMVWLRCEGVALALWPREVEEEEETDGR